MQELLFPGTIVRLNYSSEYVRKMSSTKRFALGLVISSQFPKPYDHLVLWSESPKLSAGLDIRITALTRWRRGLITPVWDSRG